jgi:hypothetical protein
LTSAQFGFYFNILSPKDHQRNRAKGMEVVTLPIPRHSELVLMRVSLAVPAPLDHSMPAPGGVTWYQ